MKSTHSKPQRPEIAFLSLGFRPFFLMGAVWAALAMLLWLGTLAGHIDLPSALDATAWHVHELLIGYISAVAAGFLLTAVPNWTGQPPVRGNGLLILVLLWLAGRVAMLLPDTLPSLLPVALDMLFLPSLALVIGRDLVASGNKRNFPVLAILLTMALANGLFHYDALRGEAAAGGIGIRLALASGIMLITLIGGRVTPAFTRNWLKMNGRDVPSLSLPQLDNWVMLASPIALLLWVLAPQMAVTGLLLILVGLANLLRLSRWNGMRCLKEPLIVVLHLAYGFVPLGYLAVGASAIWPGLLPATTAYHLWTAGAIGMMTLAVMTRASLGHTGQPLRAGRGTVAIYIAICVSVVCRVLAGTTDLDTMLLYTLSGVFWCAAFFGFAAAYGPALLRSRP